MPQDSHTYLKTHRLSGPALSFDLRDEAATLRERAMHAASGRAAKTLVKEGKLRTTVVALRKGVRLQEHRMEGASSIHVLRGRVEVETPSGGVILAAGGMVAFAEATSHAVAAQADSELLITVAQ